MRPYRRPSLLSFLLLHTALVANAGTTYAFHHAKLSLPSPRSSAYFASLRYLPPASSYAYGTGNSATASPSFRGSDAP